MSYNITATDAPLLDARMLACDIVLLRTQFANVLPESNVLDQHLDAARRALAPGPCRSCAGPNTPTARCNECGAPLASATPPSVSLCGFWWSGEFSGVSFPGTLVHVARHVTGAIDVILTWERGDSVSGFQIRDGKFIECDVVQTLVPKGATR